MSPATHRLSDEDRIALFLCGDVMTGRGVDQVLPSPCSPQLFEPVVESALEYVAMAESVRGPIPWPVDYAYVWGDALQVLDHARPDARIVNLETSITTSDLAVPKGINYRMHPRNVPVLAAAGIDCCVLANNHTLDWGMQGLIETLDTLSRACIAGAGAGPDLESAHQPAILEVSGTERVLVFGFGATDSGIPRGWAAGDTWPGVRLLAAFSRDELEHVERLVAATKRPGDVAVGSIHWGPNWGYAIPRDHRRFAHGLIDAGIDVVHGHSSHHPKAIELYRDRLILYGCGDFLNDYEGISGHTKYRSDLTVAYLPTLEMGTGRLVQLEMVPFQIRNFRLVHPSRTDRTWLANVLYRESRRFGLRIQDDGWVLRLA